MFIGVTLDQKVEMPSLLSPKEGPGHKLDDMEVTWQRRAVGGGNKQ